jgi:hypothetical protein
MKIKIQIIALICMTGWQCIQATDSLTSIAVYKIKSLVLPAAFTEALTDHIESTLLGYRKFRVLSRSNLDVLITEDRLLQSGVMSEGVSQNGNLAVVDKICTGSVSRVGTSFSFSLKIIDARSGRIDAAAQQIYTGPEEGLLGVSNRLIEQLYRQPNDQHTAGVLKSRGQQMPLPAKKTMPSSTKLSVNKSAKEVIKNDTCAHSLLKKSSVTSGRVQPADGKRKETVNGRKTSKIGKQISIGAVVIFGTLATLVLVTRK